MTNRIEAEQKLKAIFGIDHFYDEQWFAVERLMRGERILMIQRTGFGKSLCYQYPATQFDGVTVVFSPLIALMRDQVRFLNSRGISAAYINSEQSIEENEDIINRALEGKIKILYIAPERQENHSWRKAVVSMNISMVVIDEAHTISTWGHDFRPAFRRIIDLVKLMPSHLPLLATTATATHRVQADIERQIGGRLTTLRGSLARKNLRLYVVPVRSEEDKMKWLAQNVGRLPGTGLIYTGTRVDTEVYAKWLQHVGVDAVEYHAGLDTATRKDIEAGLLSNRWKCIISTNALGMGLDKPDLRFVIHTQIPASPVHYYQEIGRAGRDGKTSWAILFYNGTPNREGVPTDCQLPKSFIESARPSTRDYNRVLSAIEDEPMSERQIVKAVNLKSNQFRIIKADLIEQGVIREVKYDGNVKHYEAIYGAPKLDTSAFEQQRQAKLTELGSMVDYVNTTKPRMQFLCEYLDSTEDSDYSNCDNTTIPKLSIPDSDELDKRLNDFRATFFPVLDSADSTSKTFTSGGDDTKRTLSVLYQKPHTLSVSIDGISVGSFYKKARDDAFDPDEFAALTDAVKRHQSQKSRMTQGIAASYYGVTNVGSAIHRSKYEGGGDFPEFLLSMTLRAFAKHFGDVKFDVVMYIPPTCSANLVRNFATRFAEAINVPISHGLIKIRQTEEQKIFQNSYSKQDNIRGAFSLTDDRDVADKTVLLIDDIYDSGTTLKEAGRMLTKHGAKWIVPLVIAKVIGGRL